MSSQSKVIGSGNQPLLQDALGRLLISVAASALQTPELKGRIFDTAVLANTDFFAADLEPTNSPTTFRIYVALDTGGTLSVQRTVAAATVAEELNSGAALAGDASYTFDILVHEEDTINLQTDTGAQILYCMVIEVPGVMA